VLWFQTFVIGWTFFVGAAIGSFLNVVIYRTPLGMSVVSPRSACTACDTPIAWHDNLPVISWCLLRGKCRACAAPFSPRYALIEAAFGVYTVLLLLALGLTPAFGLSLIAGAVLTVIGAIDHDTWLIDDRATATVAALGLGVLALQLDPAGGSMLAQLGLRSAWGLGAFAALWGIGWLMSQALGQEALGGGDAPLFASLVVLLGPKAIAALMLLTSIQGLIGFALAKQFGSGPGNRELTHDDGWTPPEHALPMGIFLALAAMEYQIFGDRLTEWYLGLFSGF
jgi:leader peptidase (prepilin peptidase)/N-methyltransferase